MGEIIRWPARRRHALHELPHAAVFTNVTERQFSRIAAIIGQLEQMMACLHVGIAALPKGAARDLMLDQRAAIGRDILRAHRQLAEAKGEFGKG